MLCLSNSQLKLGCAPSGSEISRARRVSHGSRHRGFLGCSQLFYSNIIMMRLECLHVENLQLTECMAGSPGNRRHLVTFLNNEAGACSDCENKCNRAVQRCSLPLGQAWLHLVELHASTVSRNAGNMIGYLEFPSPYSDRPADN